MAVTYKSVVVGAVGHAVGRLDPAPYGGISGNYFDDGNKLSFYWPLPPGPHSLRMPGPMADDLIEAGDAQLVTVATSAPSSPVAGQIWYDATAAVKAFKVYNGSAWVLETVRAGLAAAATTFPVLPSIATQV